MQATIETEPLRSFCRAVQFEPGSVLRQKGQHYTEVYLLVDGLVSVDRQADAPELVIAGSGSPIGEISFLRGAPATATVTAKTQISAFVIDDSTLVRLEENPELSARVLRQLALIADERTSENLVLDSTVKAFVSSAAASAAVAPAPNRNPAGSAVQNWRSRAPNRTVRPRSPGHRLAVAISVPRTRLGLQHRLACSCCFRIRLPPQVFGGAFAKNCFSPSRKALPLNCQARTPSGILEFRNFSRRKTTIQLL